MRNTMSTRVTLKRILSCLSREPLKHLTIHKRLCTTMTSGSVKEITKKVHSYGKLFIDLPWNVEVKPTDPHDYPNMDTLIVKISSSSNNRVEIDKLLKINVTDELCRITANDEKFHDFPDVDFVVEAPVQYDVDARILGKSNLSITGMISDFVDAKTEKGNIVASKLQGKKMRFVSSEGGSIDLRKSLQGDIEVVASESGSIRCEKCLGTSLQVTTENGDVNLGSNYCERAIFKTVNGNFVLNNLHMDAIVDIRGKGSLSIPCLDGSLRAKIGDGDTKIHVVRLTGKSHIVSTGFIDLIVPRENNIQMTLSGNKLSIDETTMETNWGSKEKQVYETKGDIPLRVETRGNIRVTGSSWADSLRFGNFSK